MAESRFQGVMFSITASALIFALLNWLITYPTGHWPSISTVHKVHDSTGSRFKSKEPDPDSLVRPFLQFRDDDTFKITIFEDLHFGEAQDTLWGPEQDVKTLKVMRTILDIERPDLVVLNGDLITGNDCHDRYNCTWYLRELVKPMVERKIPWATTYGNHDRDVNLPVRKLYNEDRRYNLSLTADNLHVRRGEENEIGLSNYKLWIHPHPKSKVHKEDDGSIFNLYFLDSKGGRQVKQDGEPPVPVPDLVHRRAVDWLKNAIDFEKWDGNRSPPPGLVFFHIPTTASLEYQRSSSTKASPKTDNDDKINDTQDSERTPLKPREVNPETNPGLNDDNPLSSQNPEENSHLLDTLKSTSSILATFSAHDHGNDWCFPQPRVINQYVSPTSQGRRALVHCFGRRTGYGGYGNWKRGGRIVLLDLRRLAGEDSSYLRSLDYNSLLDKKGEKASWFNSLPFSTFFSFLGLDTKVRGKKGFDVDDWSFETWVRLEGGQVSGHVVVNSTFGRDEYPLVTE